MLGNTKSKISKDQKGEYVPHLEITVVVLLHCIIVNNDYQPDSRVFHIFVLHKSFSKLLDISLKNFMFLKKFTYWSMVYWSQFQTARGRR